MSGEWQDGPEDELVPLIRKQLVPAKETRSIRERAAWNRLSAGLRSFYERFVLGFAWPQIDRLREAKLREVESLSEERAASAAAKEAEARKLDAEAELLYAQAESTRLQNVARQLSLAEREQALLDAMRRIEAKGGSISLPKPEESHSREESES